MLLARRRPLTGFHKRLPLAADDAPRSRGFGPRQKVVAAPRKGLRIVSRPTAGEGIVTSSTGEGATSADWIGDIDWVGDAGRSVAASPNGHATEMIADLRPEMVPTPAPEMRTLN